MTRRPPTTEIRIVLRTILSAGVLAVLLLACAGAAAGGKWVMDDDGGAGVDFCEIQAAVNAAGAGDTIDVRSGTYVENMNNVKFIGVVTGEPDFGGAVGSGGANVQINEIISDPTGNLTIGGVTTVSYPIYPPFCYIHGAIGDSVEVCGEHRDIEDIPDWWSGVGEYWVRLCMSDHYFRILNQPDPPDRSLLELENQLMIYWFQNGKYYWVLGWDVINNMSGVPGWDNVITLKFNPAGYPNGPSFITNNTQSSGTRSDGLLIQEQGHPEVYLISGGEKHHFTSPEALLENGYIFDDVLDVSAQILAMFPSGYDISTNLHPTAGTTWLNWTWTNPPDPDFNHTEIYLNSVFQTITSAEHFNATDLTPETSYTIGTRTVDAAGNINQTYVNDTATTLPATGTTIQVTISLDSGWNLISAPLNLTTWQLGQESVVSDPLNVTPKNSLTSIYRYNTTSELFEKCTHYDNWGWAPATGSGSFTELEPGRGYWVRAENDCNLTFTGTAPSGQDVPLDADWNCIGWYSTSAAVLGEEASVGDPLNVTPENSLTSIYRYNTTSGSFEKCSHYDNWGWAPATGSESFTELEPGRGYWAMAESNCVWNHGT